MAVEDRDRSFEKALARTLRFQAGPSAASAGACPDAETLAAYHESSLPPAQMVSWKEHIAACSRCEQILVQLVATDEIAVDGSARFLKRALTTDPADTPSREVAKPRRTRYWRWLTPAGAVAALLFVWIAVRQSMPLRLDVAKNQLPASVPTTDAPPTSDAKTPPGQAGASPRPVTGSATATTVTGSDVAKRPRQSAQTFAPTAPQPPAPSSKKLDLFSKTAAPRPPTRQDAINTRSDSLDIKADQPVGRDKNNISDDEQRIVRKQADEFASALSSSPQPPSPANSHSEAVGVTAEVTRTKPVAKTKQAAAAPPRVLLQEQQPMNGRSVYGANAAVQLANAKDAAIISAPGGIAQWRLGAAGIIEHSSDSGTTWTLQTSGVVADLTAGSAPSAQVCWVVGRAGTIIRTIDAGETWLKVRSPVVEDFVAVFVVNAQQGTVSTAHETYQTSDAGLSWKKLPAE